MAARRCAAAATRVRAALKLDELVGKKVNEFVLILQPMKMRGGTGSTVAPVALR